MLNSLYLIFIFLSITLPVSVYSFFHSPLNVYHSFEGTGHSALLSKLNERERKDNNFLTETRRTEVSISNTIDAFLKRNNNYKYERHVGLRSKDQQEEIIENKSKKSIKKIKVAILGASGYTGAELMRLLLLHPNVEFSILTAGETSSGKAFSDVFPQFIPYMNQANADGKSRIPLLKKTDDVTSEEWSETECIFCCLPHATTQEIIASLPSHIKVIDLSADFRLSNIETYKEWYGDDHKAPELQKEAVYGLTEINRSQITKSNTRLIANPGCYPTAAQLSLIPLLESKMISTDDIIIDAKSGTTGAGRAAKQAFLYCEVTDGIHAYGVASHRHAPEIEQGLSLASKGKEVVVNFTPHLMPMSRGILETIYVKLKEGYSAKDLKEKLQDKYKNETFIHLLEGKTAPQTRHVKGSNYVFMNVVDDRVKGRAIIMVAIDNVVKGASGQAIQNFNLLFGLAETTALENPPMFP